MNNNINNNKNQIKLGFFSNAYQYLMWKVTWIIVSWWLEKRWAKLGLGTDLIKVHDHIHNIYATEWETNGLSGVLNLRRIVKEQIDSLSIATFLNKQAKVKGGTKDYTQLNFEEAHAHLAIFKDIFTKIDWTIQTVYALKQILRFIINIATIPFAAFNLWLLARKIFMIFAVASTGTLDLFYIDNYNDVWGSNFTSDTLWGSIKEYFFDSVKVVRINIESILVWAKETIEGKPEIPTVKPVDVLEPTLPEKGWLPSWAYDSNGDVNKYIIYGCIAIATTITIIFVSSYLNSDGGSSSAGAVNSVGSSRASDASSSGAGAAAAAGSAAGTTLWTYFSDGLKYPFKIWKWSWGSTSGADLVEDIVSQNSEIITSASGSGSGTGSGSSYGSGSG